MRKSVLWSIIACTVVVVAIAIMVFSSGVNQPGKNDSSESLSFYSSLQYRPSSHKFDWIESAIASTSKEKMESALHCGKSATEVVSFLSDRGGEKNIDGGWKAYAPTAFYPGTKKVLEPNLRLSGLIFGSPGPRYIRDIGGKYSLGVACTSAGVEKVESVSYRFITIEPRTGLWSAEPEPSIAAQ